MRILFLSTYFSPDAASTGVLMAHLAEDLNSFGHEVTIITSMPHYDGNRIWDRYRGKVWQSERSSGLSIHRLYIYVPRNKNKIAGRALSYASWNLLSAFAGMIASRPDVVFVPSPPLTNGIAGFAISRIRGVPFIYNVQDIYPDVAIRLGVLKNERKISAMRTVESFVYSRAAAVSVISEGFKCNLLSKGVPKAKIQVIPNFCDTDFVRPMPRINRFSTADGLNDRFVVLFAGNVGLSQGLDGVLEAAEHLKDHPEIQFLIVGNGAAKPALLKLTQRLALRNVIFHPFFPYQNVPEMYASSDVCLVPLKRGITEESVPSKVFTILAAARPLIASVDEESETWRLVNESECGLCVPPEDPQALAEAIISLCRDREIGIRMGLNGRAYVEKHFSRRLVAREYETLFMKVISEGT